MSTPTQTSTQTKSPQQAAQSLLSDVNSTSAAIERGDWLSAVGGVTNVAMDVISIGGDPLGAISAAGFGWVISHIKFLREPFDKLLGDVNSIMTTAQSFNQSCQQLSQSANEYRDAVDRETQGWKGAAADAYRAAADSQAKNLESLAKVTKGISEATQGAGKALAEIRKAVIDLINQACNRIIMIIIQALASSWLSFGASIAQGIAQSVVTAVQSAAKCLQKIQKLISTLQKVIQLIQKVQALVQAVKQLMQLIGGKASGDTSSLQLQGSPLNYGGNISAGTAPPGQTGNVVRQQTPTVANYSYDGYTPQTSGQVQRTPTAPGQAYQYDGYTPGTSGQVQRTQTSGVADYNYAGYTPGGGEGQVQRSQTPTGPGVNYPGYTPGGGGGQVQRTQPAGVVPTASSQTGVPPRPVQPAQSAVPPAGVAPQQRPAQPRQQRPAPPPQQRPGGGHGQGRVSQNGWPVNPPRSARQVPGTNVRVTLADGPAGDVLTHVLAQVNQRVENLDLAGRHGERDDWGHADREVRGSHAISNHASGTAVDINATRHPLGMRGTFTQEQVNEIHQILREVDGVVRWGGDYRGRADEMHFEIVGTPEQVRAVAERLRANNPQR